MKAGIESMGRKGERLGAPVLGDHIIEKAKAFGGEGISFRGIADKIGFRRQW